MTEAAKPQGYYEAVPVPPDGYVPGQFLGPALEAVSDAKVIALEQAVAWAGQGGDWKGEQPTPARIVQVAETFEAYLTEGEDQP